MTSLLKTIALISFLSIPGLIYPMVSQHRLKTKDGKPILILGDNYGLTDPILQEHADAFLLTIISNPPLSPLPFIIELKTDNGTKPSMVAELVLALGRAQQKSSDPSPIKIIPFDPREKESAEVIATSIVLSHFVTVGASIKEIDEHYNLEHIKEKERLHTTTAKTSWKEIKRKIRNNKLLAKKPFTLKGYFAHLQANREKMEALIEKYTDNPSMQAIIKALLATYTKAEKEIPELFKKSQEERFGFAVAKLYLATKTVEERLTLFDTCIRIFEDETDNLFADCFYLDKLLTLLKTENRICMLVGFHHAQKLSKHLQTLNCMLESELVGQTISYPLAVRFNIGPEFIAALNMAVNQLLAPLEGEQKAKPKDRCWVCNEKPKKLMVCSRCKEATYCSAECQTNDWKEHKKACKPIGK